MLPATLTGGYELQLRRTVLRADVDSRRTSGPVFVENGNTVINAPNGVTITGNFEVKPGAVLEITTN